VVFELMLPLKLDTGVAGAVNATLPGGVPGPAGPATGGSCGPTGIPLPGFSVTPPEPIVP